MAATPKRKGTSGRRDRRRSQQILHKPGLSTCPKCKQMKRPHFKCPSCGHYGKLEKSAPAKGQMTPAKTKSTTTKKPAKK
jgi:large subunit ribosomal protein L32